MSRTIFGPQKPARSTPPANRAKSRMGFYELPERERVQVRSVVDRLGYESDAERRVREFVEEHGSH